MKSAAPRRGCVFGLAFGLALSIQAGQFSYGQTYLERLEALIKQKQDSPEGSGNSPTKTDENETSVGELPAPEKSNSQTLSGQNSSSENKLSTMPSVLDPPVGRPPVPIPLTPSAGNQTSPENSSPVNRSGRVFLGLQAEDPANGILGVRVTSVTKHSPAWKAGFAIGDQILAINDFAILNLDAMGGQMSKTHPGETCSFLVSRSDRTLELKAVLMDAQLAGKISGNPTPTAMYGKPWLGVDVNDLTAPFRERFGVGVFKGAAVTSVAKNSPAAKASIQAGDCIVAVNGMAIESALALNRTMKDKRPGESLEFLVYRGAFSRVVSVVLEVNPSKAPKAGNRIPAPSVLQQATPNTSIVLESPANVPVPANTTITEKDRRIGELEDQVKELRESLRISNEQLQSTQLKLDRILQALSDDSK